MPNIKELIESRLVEALGQLKMTKSQYADRYHEVKRSKTLKALDLADDLQSQAATEHGKEFAHDMYTHENRVNTGGATEYNHPELKKWRADHGIIIPFLEKKYGIKPTATTTVPQKKSLVNRYANSSNSPLASVIRFLGKK